MTKRRILAARRAFVLVAVMAGSVGLTLWMARLLGAGGWHWSELGMLVAFALSLPWTVLGFVNATIGFVLCVTRRDPATYVNPTLNAVDPAAPISARTAILVCLRNEDPAAAIGALDRLLHDLSAFDGGAGFAAFILSDTDRPEIAARETELASALAQRAWLPVTYRRREQNSGFKAGNIQDFCARWGDGFDFMLVMDIDSVISAEAALRLVRVMQADRRLGLVQQLVVGAPASSPFARIFQFGMRQGMRAYALGAAWWQGDAGVYWGHHALIRIAPFHRHARLPELPKRGGGTQPILSHDQVEATFLRGAGWHVRVIADEFGSFEDHPPSLLEFIRREARWCQGNFQYRHLILRPGLHAMGRLQLLLAMLLYTGAPCWIAFLGFALARAWAPADEVVLDVGSGWALFATMTFLVFAPKTMGLAEILLERAKRRAYGGFARAALGGGIEFVFSCCLSPIVALSLTLFQLSLLRGRPIAWNTANRQSHVVSIALGVRWLWPHTLIGAAYAVLLAQIAPGALIWAAPVVLPLILAIPYAWVTANPALGRVLMRGGFCAMPEESRPQPRRALSFAPGDD